MTLRILLLAFSCVHCIAQRAIEKDGRVIFEDAAKRATDLGVGFNPIITAEGKVWLIRGQRHGYGEDFDCARPEKKNWIVEYDPRTKQEVTIFDQPIQFDGPGDLGFCVFTQMQRSYNGSTLYLVASTYATSGSLAIINLVNPSMVFVPGVVEVYIIESGPHRDELIYQRRVWHTSPEDGLDHPYYPFIHALSDGRQIKEISNEDVPTLRNYLLEIGATVHLRGEKLP